MARSVWQSLLLSPVIAGAVATAVAAESEKATVLAQVTPATAESRPVALDGTVLTLTELEAEPATLQDQVTSVSQLTDVRPTDWAFQALQSLVERYGCIVGYPDRTYRGNQALTRFEFAAGLNACLDRISELISAATAEFVRKEDLDTVRRLQDQFARELAVLRGRVDQLETRTARLERQQFSTTTKLNGEVVVGLAGVAAGNEINENKIDKNPFLGHRTRLNFDASFTGEDLLRVRLQAGNLESALQEATSEGNLRFATPGGSGSVAIDALLYQFKLGDRTTITLEANAGATDDFIPTINPFLDGDGASGALTDFGTRNPIYYLPAGAGIAVLHEFSDSLSLGLGYLAGDANNPSEKNGLFNGRFGAIAQLTFQPSNALNLGLVYVRAYNNDFSSGSGVTGSNNASFISNGLVSAATTDSFGLNASFQLNPNIVINGAVGYTHANAKAGSGEADIWNWSVGLAFPDLLKSGNLAGIIVGMEPRVSNASGDFREDEDTSLHIEGFFQLQLNDNLAITPGIIWLTAPDHNNDNKDAVIGVIRTTFTF
jgi:hypothetical protein